MRTTGAPNVYKDDFSGSPGKGVLVIKNGEKKGKHRVTSAVVFVNGIQVLGPCDFKQAKYLMEVPATAYTITATGPGGVATDEATVIVITNDPPSISIVRPHEEGEEPTDCGFNIQWTDEDEDDNASISLYYDADGSGHRFHSSAYSYFKRRTGVGSDRQPFNPVMVFNQRGIL